MSKRAAKPAPPQIGDVVALRFRVVQGPNANGDYHLHFAPPSARLPRFAGRFGSQALPLILSADELAALAAAATTGGEG